ncbi:transcriptional regulator, Crp/Fnr family [Dokdonella immobilis]|uniref:CRP-like protein Clp n=2 Tax=Dokdonella immobilis TaxID=578942 RepID=A0A1I4ZB38_9GAMM|nr:transcriptional regulator, Crp/Fnr family [Dokdonella immobilis]
MLNVSSDVQRQFAVHPTFTARCGIDGMEGLVGRTSFVRRKVKCREHLFHAGQPRRSLFLVHAGTFKISMVTADGREKVAGFRYAGELLGLDALDIPSYACDVVALEDAEVWELPCSELTEERFEFVRWITSTLASEVRRDWNWMLTLGTLNAEQRVTAFLLDLAARMASMGFSERRFLLRMTRADIGSFLAIKLETVTRALSRLQTRGMISVRGRSIDLLDAARMRASLESEDRAGQVRMPRRRAAGGLPFTSTGRSVTALQAAA